jgi:hypothetical protein
MFNISKSTLFRWEHEDWFPPVGRDLNNKRQYTWEHIQAITMKRNRRQFEQAASAEDEVRLGEIWGESLSLHKFIYMGDATGLQELAEYPGLAPETTRQLLRAALEDYEPGDETFCQILRVILEKNCKR